MTGRLPHSQNRHLTFKANMGVGRHGWLRLTPAYGVRLVRERISHLPAGSIVTDPFSGTGTTPLAAAELGHSGQSVDLNPFLIWLGRTKTRHYSAEVVDAARSEIAAVTGAARGFLTREDLWQPNLFKIEKWWSVATLQGLKALRHAIDERGERDEITDLLEIGLCRTLISRSNAAFNHQSMSFKAAKPEDGLFDPNEAQDTLTVFGDETGSIVDSAAYDLVGNAKIVHGDSRTAAAELAPCDLLLTSPPYVNRMSYIRELRPYMYWLRFLDRASDAGDLDWKAIGGTWGTATSKLNSWTPEVETPVAAEMTLICEAIAQDGGRNGPLLANYVHKYFHDMWLHFQAVTPRVKVGGAVSYIVGNSTFYGHVVPAQDWYAAMLKELGYTDVAVDTIRKRNSNKALYEYDVRGTRT
ncbi:putative DNA methyltransferase [Nocardia nova SH22a]|uniref:site-specific DNA-methyltransferase (cytosine-N(4)-specific) n=1 Tax=Nocardia nova SH22a TaxID=1415166 RepID=W5TCE1_9NOCA|nr:putative DNA methyltransferase [Nocardia nova SH22a]